MAQLAVLDVVPSMQHRFAAAILLLASCSVIDPLDQHGGGIKVGAGLDGAASDAMAAQSPADAPVAEPNISPDGPMASLDVPAPPPDLAADASPSPDAAVAEASPLPPDADGAEPDAA